MENLFDIGQIAYSKADPNRPPIIITAITILPMGGYTYYADNGESYYEMELTPERPEGVI